MKIPLYSSNLSWLSFNYRVLQEAKSSEVPLLERLKFLAIYSSNLDEFFRVKVAAIRSLKEDTNRKKLDFDPDELLETILKTVQKQQEEFGKIFRNEILPGLSKEGIYLLTEDELKNKHSEYIEKYFQENILPVLKTAKLRSYGKTVFLENKKIYILFSGEDLSEKSAVLVELPGELCPRFVKMPAAEGTTEICFIDDIIKICFPRWHNGKLSSKAYEIKLSRDAELNIDDEFAGSLVKKIKRSVKSRSKGLPARFLFDETMPEKLRNLLKTVFDFEDNDMVAGAKYHNFNDFFDFPDLVQRPDLLYPKIEKIPLKIFDEHKSVFKIISDRDVIIHYPYNSYDYFLKFLNQAAESRSVSEIKITLYRVAKSSKVCEALIKAARRGIKVTAFFEVKARFDEESNLYWSEELKKAGATVLYSFPGLKVHAKLCLISKRKGNSTRKFAYLCTGNFNEVTSNLYTDFGLLTSDKKLTTEVNHVFDILEDMRKRFDFSYLLPAPDKLRLEIYRLIQQEIIHHLDGKPAGIILKMNAIDDPEMIEKLYEASKYGVPITMLVRGICRLVPGEKHFSENINIISIVDRYLEHNRMYVFKNGGDSKVYLSSADFMNRNLSKRIEVAFPILNPEIKSLLLQIIDIYLHDNTKARIIDKHHKNAFKKAEKEESSLNAQTALYDFYKNYYGIN